MDWRKGLVLLAGCAMGTATAADQRPRFEPIETIGLPAKVNQTPVFEFMGIEVGGALGPECPVEHLPYAGAVYKTDTATTACWMASNMRSGSETNLRNNAELRIVPMSNKRPLGTGAVFASVVGGKVAGLTVSTDGFVHAQEIFEQLKLKLGKPTTEDTVQVVSGVGAKFTSPRASWDLPGVQVQFNGIVNAVNTGIITVRTNAEKTREQARRLQEAKSF